MSTIQIPMAGIGMFGHQNNRASEGISIALVINSFDLARSLDPSYGIWNLRRQCG